MRLILFYNDVNCEDIFNLLGYVSTFGLKIEEETSKMLHLEKISWTDHVRNEEVLLRVNEQRDILHEIRKRKAN